MFATLELLAKQRRELDAQEAAWLKDIAAYDRSGDYQIDGYQNAAAAIRAACRMNHGVARASVELARKLEHLAEVATAFEAGDISRQHATVIAGAYTPERAQAITAAEPQLVEIARQYTPHRVSAVVRYLADALDGDGGAATDEALHQRRRYHLSTTLNGMLATDGLYDTEAGEIHRTALDAEMARDLRKNDPRTPAQRRADAHTNIMRQALNRGDFGESHGVRPHLSVSIDLEDLPGTNQELRLQVRGEARANRHLSAITLERLACDCDISRIITSGQSEILDVGRATRTIAPALWKAVVKRDRHCQAPSCDQAPEHCEAHHIIHWLHGGPTTLQNLQLLCWHHHRQQHIQNAKTRAPARGG